jgi:hypothetical protein
MGIAGLEYVFDPRGYPKVLSKKIFNLKVFFPLFVETIHDLITFSMGLYNELKTLPGQNMFLPKPGSDETLQTLQT